MGNDDFAIPDGQIREQGFSCPESVWLCVVCKRTVLYDDIDEVLSAREGDLRGICLRHPNNRSSYYEPPRPIPGGSNYVMVALPPSKKEDFAYEEWGGYGDGVPVKYE